MDGLELILEVGRCTGRWCTGVWGVGTQEMGAEAERFRRRAAQGLGGIGEGDGRRKGFFVCGRGVIRI